MKQSEMTAIGKMEVRAYEKKAYGVTDQLVEKGSIKAIFEALMDLPIEVTDELGTKHTVDVRTCLATEALKNLMEKGVELKDMATLQQIMGEQKTTIDVNAKMSAADLFGDIRN